MATFPVSQPVGSRLYGPVTLADTITAIDVSLSNWPQSNRFAQVDTEMSFDDGATWQYTGGMNATPGGRSIGRNGTDACQFVIGPMPTGVGRQLRATVLVTGGTVSCTMTIVTS